MESVRIFVSSTNNPLAVALKEMILKEKDKLESVDNIIDADMVISFAYHSADDILKMETMYKEANEYPDKKFVFLSWFHPLKHYEQYRHLFNPDNPACMLMDTDRYRILQLPVDKLELVQNLTALSNII